MLAASLNAFFCASPIYGSAEDFTFPLDITVSKEVTPAAKQQVGETRKKRLAQRLAFFRFDYSSGIILSLIHIFKRAAALKFSMGRITMPHQLARLVLTEQIYRACTINAGMKYHK